LETAPDSLKQYAEENDIDLIDLFTERQERMASGNMPPPPPPMEYGAGSKLQAYADIDAYSAVTDDEDYNLRALIMQALKVSETA
jgi:hypothetical protein